MRIFNQTKYYNREASGEIRVLIIPIGAFFDHEKKYTPKSFTINSHSLAGVEIIIPEQTSSSTYSFIDGNWDRSGGDVNESQFSYGYGKYKFEFYRWENESWVYSNYVNIDFRDVGPHFTPPNTAGSLADMRLDYFTKDTITYQFDARHDSDNANYKFKFWHIDLVNKELKVWDKYGTCIPPWIPDIGTFNPDPSNNEEYLRWPINANKYNGNIGHENPGDLGMNIVIDYDVTTQDTLIENPTNIITAKNGYLKIASGKTFDMITAVNGSNNLIVQDISVLTLQSNSHLIIGASNKLTLKRYGKISMGPNAEILVKTGGLFCNEGGSIRGGIITFEKTHVFCSQLADSPFGDSTKVVLLDSAVLEIPDSTTLHFTGKQSGLVMNPHSKLKMGIGSKIIFDSSASIYADGAEFSSTDSLEKWEGIFLTNSDADTIINCTFSNAKTALTIINDPDDAESVFKNRIITDNTFNIPNGGVHMGIYGENNYRILLQKNDFNMPVYYPSGSPVQLLYAGVYHKNSSSVQPDSGDVETNQTTNYSLNITGNTFSNGCASLILANYTSSYLPYLIKNNTFNNTASVNLIGINITGTISYNNFTSDYVPLGIHLISSSPNLYKNNIRSRDVGLHLSGHCYPNLAPYASSGDLIWSGGNNVFNTAELDNIQLSSSGYAETDFGNNNFNTANSSSFNIYGWLDSNRTNYTARNNCWNSSSSANVYLKKYGSSDTVPVPVISLSDYNCTGEASAESWSVCYHGNGIYDSVKVSDDNTGEHPSAAELLSNQAKDNSGNGLYEQAIIDYKYLFDNYPEFSEAASTLYYLYESYQGLDTNSGQNYRQPLYQDLIDYLETKILSDEYTKYQDFLDNAYDIILMAQSIIDLNSAAGGYEFLAFNHPDPDIRLEASWNYAEIEELLNMGNGGGAQLEIRNPPRRNELRIGDQLRVKSYELRKSEKVIFKEIKGLKRLNEIIANDPVMSKLKKSFDKTSKEKSEKVEKQIRDLSDKKNNENSVSENKQVQTFQNNLKFDKDKEDRAKRNIFESVHLSKEEKLKKRIEDLSFTTILSGNDLKYSEKVNIPFEYKLYQNYPNPFNPSTVISYSIPKNSKVTLKVFDILGNEVATLVNGDQVQGNYSIEFSATGGGANFASGIYFYKLTAGEYVDVKKMILVK